MVCLHGRWVQVDHCEDTMLTEFMKKPLTAAVLLASAAGGPYLLYETDVGRQAMQSSAGGFESAGASTASGSFWSLLGYGPGSGDATAGYLGPAGPVPGGNQELWDYTSGVPSLDQLQTADPRQPLVGGPIRDLREVLRFDITPGWVAQNFARVSTVLAEVKLDGLRVPIVTGTSESDLAATVTYYFDNQQQLRRINLQGLTGDPTGIAALMQQYYGLKPEATLGGHLYTTRWNRRVTSMLHVAPAPIMYSTAQHSRYAVFLELNQPDIPYGLSLEAEQILQTGHQTERW